MPVSAYLRAFALLICAGIALFASAGSIAIAAFWVYLAILAAVFVAAFVLLDRGLLQERMRPGGKPTPLGLRLLNVVLLIHWVIAGLDRAAGFIGLTTCRNGCRRLGSSLLPQAMGWFSGRC